MQTDLIASAKHLTPTLSVALLLESEALQPFSSWIETGAADGRDLGKPHLQDQLGALLHSFAQEHYPHAERAATVSQWSTDYFCATLIPLVGFAIIAQACAGDAQQTRYRLQGAALKAQRVPPVLHPIQGCTPEAYVCGVLLQTEAQFVRALAAAGQVSERLLWTNLAVVVEVICESLIAHPQYAQAAHTVRQAVFSLRLPGYRSLITELVQEHPLPAADLPAPWRVRRICCLHYRLTEKAPLCSNCPLLLQKPQEEQAAYLRSELL